MKHVRWIGGGSGAGKTTITRALTQAHGLTRYDTDAVMRDHATRHPIGPHTAAFTAMTMDERWADRDPHTMLDTFHWYQGEGFQHIEDDLRAIDTPVLAEGFRLLPHLVAPHLRDGGHAVWLLPTPAFRHAALTERGTLWSIPERTNNPQRALANLLERDRLFTERITEETRRLGLATITVDIGTGRDELREAVTHALAL
ncbi:hypothetical protein Afil01_14060 [Actinorhabdospora filicis]|uniref:AAA domain-containing protein n=1 Tax=Actinorhabdospora filicis TaxID=1785913 RepID=A0A9W6SJA1_9ACTN|nr:hypothetical protein [Actinorhabdospora filicis]GLZ76599.1 hypothetical protein Afil01_14060 [Actinorhabdospora filicis]